MSVTFTTQLTNVNVYPFTGIRILVQPVVVGASGEYVVGTFLNSVGYQLYLNGGQGVRPLTVGAPYYAVGTNAETGEQVVTHFMYYQPDGEAQWHFGFVQTVGVHASAPQPQVEEAAAV